MNTPEFRFPATIDDVVHHLQQSRAYLQAALQKDYVTPPPGRWSKAEILFHLVLSEQSITRAFQKLLAAQPVKAPRPIAIIREQWELMHGGLLDRTQTMNGPERVQPLQTPSFTEIQAMMQETREGHIKLLSAVTYEALDAIGFPHGKFGELSGLVWSSLVAHHEFRHTQQLLELEISTI